VIQLVSAILALGSEGTSARSCDIRTSGFKSSRCKFYFQLEAGKYFRSRNSGLYLCVSVNFALMVNSFCSLLLDVWAQAAPWGNRKMFVNCIASRSPAHCAGWANFRSHFDTIQNNRLFGSKPKFQASKSCSQTSAPLRQIPVVLVRTLENCTTLHS
jgi:hypothetical protein